MKIICQFREIITITLNQGQETFSVKGYGALRAIQSFSNYPTSLTQHKSRQRQYMNERMLLCSNKTLFTKTDVGQDLAHRSALSRRAHLGV